MNPRRTLQSTFWAMIALQTVGGVELPGKKTKASPLGGQGTHKLPAPRVYVAVIVLWGILGLVAETGFSRWASRFSVLVLLTGAVFGPFGQTAVAFLEGVAKRFAIAPVAPSSSSSSGGVEQGALTAAEALV